MVQSLVFGRRSHGYLAAACFCLKYHAFHLLLQDIEDSGDIIAKGAVVEQTDPIDPCLPVSDVSNTQASCTRPVLCDARLSQFVSVTVLQNDGYLGSWVAEVSVVHRDAAAVKSFLDREGV